MSIVLETRQGEADNIGDRVMSLFVSRYAFPQYTLGKDASCAPLLLTVQNGDTVDFLDRIEAQVKALDGGQNGGRAEPAQLHRSLQEGVLGKPAKVAPDIQEQAEEQQ